MNARFLILLLCSCPALSVRAAPEPYSWEVVYRSASPKHSVTASSIRQDPASKREVDVLFNRLLRAIHWDDAKVDAEIKRKAGPIVMLVDCYSRVQPDPPSEPRFETLYITRTHAYSDENHHIKITPRIRGVLYSAFTR